MGGGSQVHRGEWGGLRDIDGGGWVGSQGHRGRGGLRDTGEGFFGRCGQKRRRSAIKPSFNLSKQIRLDKKRKKNDNVNRVLYMCFYAVTPHLCEITWNTEKLSLVYGDAQPICINHRILNSSPLQFCRGVLCYLYGSLRCVFSKWILQFRQLGGL